MIDLVEGKLREGIKQVTKQVGGKKNVVLNTFFLDKSGEYPYGS